MEENIETADALPMDQHQEKPQSMRWLRRIWLHPRETLKEISAFEEGIWLIPLLLLSGLQLIKSLAERPIRVSAAQAALQEQMLKMQSNSGSMGGDSAATATPSGFTTGTLMTFVLPLLLGIASIWIVWFLLGSILHLGLTLGGNRSSATASLNLAAWASLPGAVRLLAQTIAILSKQQLIAAPGLAGFVDPSISFGYHFLMNLDLFFLWKLGLLVAGTRELGKISRSRAVWTVLVCGLLILILMALPGTLSGALSGLLSGSAAYF